MATNVNLDQAWTIERPECSLPLPEMPVGPAMRHPYLGEISSAEQPERAPEALRQLARGTSFSGRNNPWPRRRSERGLPRVWTPADDRCSPASPDESRRRSDVRPVVMTPARVKGPASPPRDESPDAVVKRKAKFKRHKRSLVQARAQSIRIRKMFADFKDCRDCGKRMNPDGLYDDRPIAIERAGVFVLSCRACVKATKAVQS